MKVFSLRTSSASTQRGETPGEGQVRIAQVLLAPLTPIKDAPGKDTHIWKRISLWIKCNKKHFCAQCLYQQQCVWVQWRKVKLPGLVEPLSSQPGCGNCCPLRKLHTCFGNNSSSWLDFAVPAVFCPLLVEVRVWQQLHNVLLDLWSVWGASNPADQERYSDSKVR